MGLKRGYGAGLQFPEGWGNGYKPKQTPVGEDGYFLEHHPCNLIMAFYRSVGEKSLIEHQCCLGVFSLICIIFIFEKNLSHYIIFNNVLSENPVLNFVLFPVFMHHVIKGAWPCKKIKFKLITRSKCYLLSCRPILVCVGG